MPPRGKNFGIGLLFVVHFGFRKNALLSFVTALLGCSASAKKTQGLFRRHPELPDSEDAMLFFGMKGMMRILAHCNHHD